MTQNAGIPFLNPTTRTEARDNAIVLASLASQNMQSHGLLAHANTWAAIAATFPENDDPRLIIPDDPRYPIPSTDVVTIAADETAVLHHPQVAPIHPSHIPEGQGPITVDPVAWDVLRTLAIRYVLGSMTQGVEVDLMEEHTGPQVWSLQFTRMPDSSVVHVSVSRPTDDIFN